MRRKALHVAMVCNGRRSRGSLAHGGKDRHPYPVPVRVYDETTRVLKTAVANAKLGRDEALAALKRFERSGVADPRSATSSFGVIQNHSDATISGSVAVHQQPN